MLKNKSEYLKHMLSTTTTTANYSEEEAERVNNIKNENNFPEIPFSERRSLNEVSQLTI